MSATTVLPGRRGLLPRRRLSNTAAAVLLAGLLSAAMVGLVLSQHGGGVGLALAAVAMTLPVGYVWRAPTIAAFALAGAAVVNDGLLAPLARCGAGLPATFFVAFVAGCALGKRRGRLALAATAVSIVLQCLFDPRLGAGVIALMMPLDVIFFGAGLYVRHRAAMVATLRDVTAELREQREQTARLVVAADREQLTARLNHVLIQRLDALSQAVGAPGDASPRFAMIEQLGRQTLDQMRELLGSLRDSPIRPEPGLDDLADICSRVTTAHVNLTVDGTLRSLPPSIELSVCRIVEQLLRMLPDDPSGRVQLHVAVTSTGIDVAIDGTPAVGINLDHVQALASAQAALHGGNVAVTDDPGRRRARVWLPLVTAHG